MCILTHSLSQAWQAESYQETERTILPYKKENSHASFFTAALTYKSTNEPLWGGNAAICQHKLLILLPQPTTNFGEKEWAGNNLLWPTFLLFLLGQLTARAAHIDRHAYTHAVCGGVWELVSWVTCGADMRLVDSAGGEESVLFKAQNQSSSFSCFALPDTSTSLCTHRRAQ